MSTVGGRLALVVGPSGAGKDSLIAAARRELAGDRRFVFARRTVTRPANAALEDHDTMTEDEFDRRLAAGGFALSWSAHGLRYGLGVGLVDDLARGSVVVANGSRAMVAIAAERFPETRVVLIDAARAIRAERLARRGRENLDEIAARLAREVDVPLDGAIRIDNSGPLADGIALFLDVLRAFAPQ